MTTQKSELKYIGDGNGGHLTGIPARDLTADEVMALTTKEYDACIGSGLYEEVNNGE